MKKFIWLLLGALLFSSAFVGCSSDNNGDMANDATNVFDATVIDAKNGLLVTPVAGSSELSSSDKILVSVESQEGANEVNVRPNQLKPGDLIRITYDGLIAESYPAQIKSSKIDIIGRNLVIDAYEAVIDDIYQEDSGINGGINMIAFDTTEWADLSNAEKDILFGIMEEEYGIELIDANYNDIKEMGLIDEDGLYFKEGILIEMKDIEYNEQSKQLNASISKLRAGDAGIGWDVKAKYKNEKWEIIRDNMWIS